MKDAIGRGKPIDNSAGTMTWPDFNARLASDGGYRIAEAYPAGELPATLLSRLHDEGLIYLINRQILHPLGLSVGVYLNSLKDDRVAIGLTLSQTDDPEGIAFRDEDVEIGRAKLAQHHPQLVEDDA